MASSCACSRPRAFSLAGFRAVAGAASGIDQLLLAREEGVAVGAHFDVNDGRRRARHERVAARALDCCPLVFRMNPGFHCKYPCWIVDSNEVGKYSCDSKLEASCTLAGRLTRSES